MSDETQVESFATVEDLENRWHILTDSEKRTAETLLGDASDKIRSDYPTSWRQCEPTTLRRIVCQMVKRAMLVTDDREGISQRSQTTGSFADSWTFTNPDGDLYLTSSERKSLTAGSRRIFTVQLGG